MRLLVVPPPQMVSQLRAGNIDGFCVGEPWSLVAVSEGLGHLDGAVPYGDTVDGAWFFQLMRSGTDISDLRENLLFGETHLGDAGHGGHTQAANMSDEMQFYREEARYLERTVPWVERVGLSYIKSRLLNDEVGRKALHKRFLESQEVAQIDPWRQRAEGAGAHEFTALGQVG